MLPACLLAVCRRFFCVSGCDVLLRIRLLRRRQEHGREGGGALQGAALPAGGLQGTTPLYCTVAWSSVAGGCELTFGQSYSLTENEPARMHPSVFSHREPTPTFPPSFPLSFLHSLSLSTFHPALSLFLTPFPSLSHPALRLAPASLPSQPSPPVRSSSHPGANPRCPSWGCLPRLPPHPPTLTLTPTPALRPSPPLPRGPPFPRRTKLG